MENPCNFSAHRQYANLPQSLIHPSHPHPLTLLDFSPCPFGSFICNACRDVGSGFNYYCSYCNFNLHISCALAPLSITHQATPCQELKLAFQVPYPNNAFFCNICGQNGSDQWVYMYGGCLFGAHLKCVMALTPPIEASIYSTSTPENPRHQHMGWARPTAEATAGGSNHNGRNSRARKCVKKAATIGGRVIIGAGVIIGAVVGGVGI